jgi:tRNA1(Val) A37 N6-methylase TrmN6
MSHNCKVCHGTGHLERIQKNHDKAAGADAVGSCGTITRGRRDRLFIPPVRPAGYDIEYWGPLVKSATLQCHDVVILRQEQQQGQDENVDDSDRMMMMATASMMSTSSSATFDTTTTTKTCVVVHTKDDDPSSFSDIPGWLPKSNEQLCNLVGHFRILQKVDSHRWTTDDLVTAAVACRHLLSQWSTTDASTHRPRYLDLGTGNGSVLQMVLHHMLILSRNSSPEEEIMPWSEAVGVEARAEAVALARRSLSFNLGEGRSDHDQQQQRQQQYHHHRGVKIVHADFRTLISSPITPTNPLVPPSSFHLITGTPPYFRVDFECETTTTTTTDTHRNDDDDDNPVLVHRAIIRQGGMPMKSMQSAPARCEFRGGFEAYCTAARHFIDPTDPRSTFCVCINFANHDRAVRALHDHGFYIHEIVHVHGRIGRPTLFCAFVAKLQPVATATTQPKSSWRIKHLNVRDEHGEWTQEYKEYVLEFMFVLPKPTTTDSNENHI